MKMFMAGGGWMDSGICFKIDLMPPAFEEGLGLWSNGDGTPDAPTYDTAANARLAKNDPDFGDCLELRKVNSVQRLRYAGEIPFMRGSFIEVTVRIKALRGPLPLAHIAAWTGGRHGRSVPGMACMGPVVSLGAHDEICQLRAVIGPEPFDGVDMVWSTDVLYAHIGLDLIGPDQGVVRVDALGVRDVSDSFPGAEIVMPGFESFEGETPGDRNGPSGGGAL
jgi:hypothetical protein